MGEPESGASGGNRGGASSSSPAGSASPPMPPLQSPGAVAASPVAHRSSVPAVAVAVTGADHIAAMEQSGRELALAKLDMDIKLFLNNLSHPNAMEQLGMSFADYVRMEAPPAVAEFLLSRAGDGEVATWTAEQWRQEIAQTALQMAVDQANHDEDPATDDESGSDFDPDEDQQQADADADTAQPDTPALQPQPARPANAAGSAAQTAAVAAGGSGAAAAAAAAGSGEESGEDAAPPPRVLTAEERLQSENMYLLSLSALDANAPLVYSLPHPQFPPNVNPEGSLEWLSLEHFYSPEFKAACLPLLGEFPTVDSANKAWDALVRAHPKEKTPRLVPIMMLLISRAYFVTQFRLVAPNAFQSFCHYGLREVTRTLLQSPFFCPPANNNERDRALRLHSFRLLMIYLHLVQTASLDLLESLPAPIEPLLEVLEVTLSSGGWKAVKAWGVDLMNSDALQVRQWLQLPVFSFAINGRSPHTAETKVEIERLKLARRQRRQQLAVAAAAAEAAAVAGPRVPGGVPPHRAGATVQTLDDDEVQIVEPPRQAGPVLPEGQEGEAPVDAEMAAEGAAVVDGGGAVSKFTLKLPSKDDAMLVAALHDAPNRMSASAQLAADLADGGSEPGDTEMMDAPLPPERPPPPNEQMPVDDDVRGEAGSDNDEVRESGPAPPAVRGNRDGEYDNESVEGRESTGSVDDEVQLAAAPRRGDRSPTFGRSSPVSSRSNSPSAGASATPSPSPQTEQQFAAADPTLAANVFLWTRRDLANNVCDNLLLHFFAVAGPRRLLDLLERSTAAPAAAAPTAAAAAAPSSAAAATPAAAPEAGDAAAAPVAVAAAPSATPSAAPVRDYPPIVHTSFGREIMAAAKAAGTVPADAPAVVTPDSIQHTVHLTCPPLMLLRRVVGMLQVLRPSLRTDVQAQLLCRLFHFISPRIQFITEAQLKGESSSQIALLLSSCMHLYESAYFYSYINSNMIIDPDSSLPHPSKVQLELFEIELAVRLLRCTFLEKRIQGLRYLTRFLENSEAANHRVASHPEHLAAALLATSKTYPQSDSSHRRAPVVICSSTAAHTMVSYKLVEILFGEQLHIQVLKRADFVLRELAAHDALSAQHVELMWAASRGKHESVVQTIFHIFEHFTDRLKPRPAVYLYRRIYALPLAEYDHHLIRLIFETTRQLLGNHTSTYLWNHTHNKCTLQRMRTLWQQHQADKKAATISGQQAGCVLPSLPGVGVEPDLTDAAFVASWVYLTHSAAAPRLPYDDYPPGAPVPPFDLSVPLPDDSSIRPAKNEYFGIDLLWRGFNLGNGNGSSSSSGVSPQDKGAENGAAAAAVASLPAVLRDQCFTLLKPMLLWPHFEDPRPTCARRLEYVMLCFKNVQRSHNVYHSLLLMRDLIETFANPSLWNNLREPVGGNWDDRFHLVQWLNTTRGGIGAALFTELSAFSRAVQQRLSQPVSPDADSHSLAFWDGPAAQLQRRLEFIAYIFNSLRKASIVEAKAAAAAAAAAATAAAAVSAPMAVDGEAPATVAAASATAPVAAPMPPPASNPLQLFERNVAHELFEQWLLPSFMSDDLRDVVFSWLSQCLLDGLLSDELLLRVFHHSIPRLNFASLTSLGLQFVLQAFRRININGNKLVADPPPAAFRAGAPNVQRRVNLAARASADNFRVVAYPLDGVDYLWSAALHAQDRVVSNTATTVLMRLHKNIDAALRVEINSKYLEAVARCMKHVHDCTVAIQQSGANENQLSVAMSDATDTGAGAAGSRMSVADLVAELGRGFNLLNNFLQHGEGEKPLSHEARLKQATAPPQPAASAASGSSSSSGDILTLDVRAPDVTSFRLRLPSHNSVRELKLAFLATLGLTKGTADDVTVLIKGSHIVNGSVTLASLDIGESAILIRLKPSFKETISPADWADVVARVHKHVAEFDAQEAGQALASSFVSASTAAAVEAATTLSTALVVSTPAATVPAAPAITVPAAPTESKQQEEKEGGAPATDAPAVASPPGPVIHHPSTILSRPEYFQQLFDLLSLSIPASSLTVASARSSHIAEHAWKLLMQLPTNAQMLLRLKTLSSSDAAAAANSGVAAALQSNDKIHWDVLLPRDSLHQLHYSLQIIFSIIPHNGNAATAAVPVADQSVAPAANGQQPASAWNAAEWESAFVARGGLRHLIHILVESDFSLRTGAAGSLQPSASPMPPASPMPTTPSNAAASAATAAASSTMSQCQQTFECLALLLKIILRFTHPHAHAQPAAVGVDGTASSVSIDAAADQQHADGTRKRKAADGPLVAVDPQQSKRRAVEPVQSDAFSSELQSVFTFEVVRKLFQLWLEVASMPRADASAALLPLSSSQSSNDVTIIGPSLPRNNASSSGGPAAAAFRAAATSDVMHELVRDSLQMLTNILTRDSSSEIARKFFFHADVVSLWLRTLLTSAHSMKDSADHLVSVARFWSHQLQSSPLPHLSRFIFHVVLDLLLSPEHSDTLMQNRYHSSALMAVPVKLLQLLQADIVAASALSKKQMDAVSQWSVQSLHPLVESSARTLRINGMELVFALFAKLKSYPLVEGFDDYSSDETLIGYLDFASQVVAALTVTPPPKLLPAVATAEDEEAKAEAAPIGPVTAAAAAASSSSSGAGAVPRTINVLPSTSTFSKLVEEQQWISFVYNDCLFEVRHVYTPLDVPLANQLPRCKHFTTRNRAFNLLRQLAQTSRQNFTHLQRLAIASQRNRSDDCLGFNYAPDTRKKHGHYVGLVNQGATCYMNSLMQQLFMVPEFRFGVLAQLSTDEIEDETDRADSLMFQLQAIFANLMDSDDASYDAAGFCAAYKDYDGQPMAKSVQMDVNEFFNVLFEKLEQSLKGSPHANLLDHVFGGTLSNQLLGRESSCSHQRSRDENFYILSLDVKGKKNVGESLKSFVEGEMLEGDNKFLCGECQRKVDTLKRVCIKNTPNNLILHLKRFEFDLDSMMKIKINDEFQFPLELDLYDYTIEGLEAAAAAKEEAAAKGEADKATQSAEEGKEDEGAAGAAGGSAAGGAASSTATAAAAAFSSVASAAAAAAAPGPVDRSDYLYELAGVIVHQGLGAGSGHYYSYAMERCPLPHQDHSSAVPQWMCFNDTRVEPFNISQLGDSCFGGSTQEGADWFHKPYSAYMLFYQKKSIAHRPHAPLVCSIPRQVQPAADAVAHDMQLEAEAQAVDAAHAAVKAAMPAHLPSAVETFTPLAKRVGLTVLGHCSKPAHMDLDDTKPLSCVVAGSPAGKKKRKHTADAGSEEAGGEAGGEAKDGDEKGSPAAAAEEEQEEEEDDEHPLSPEDKERRLHCASYRTRVATEPVTSLRRCVPLEEQSALLPSSLFDTIWRSNTELSQDVFHFDSYCLDFVFTYAVQYAYDFTPDARDRELQTDVPSDKVQMRAIELAVQFLCNTLLHTRAKSSLVDWEGSLKRMLRCSVASSRYFLRILTEDVDLCVRALMVCSVPAFKKSFTAVIIAALETLRPLEAAHLLDYDAPPKSKAASVQEEGEEPEAEADEDAHARKKQRVAEGGEGADGEGDVDMEDAAEPAAAETEAAGADEEEEEEEEEEVEEEARYRTTVSARFIGTLLEVSPLTLNEHYQRTAHWWHLLYDIASLGDEECAFMLLKYDTVVLAVLSILGADAAVEPGIEYDEESWVSLKKLRIKKKLSIKSVVQLMALLLSKACTGGRLDSTKLHDIRRTRKAVEDFNGLWDLLLQSRDDLELIPPVQQLLMCVCNEREKVSMRLTQHIATAHVDEYVAELQFSLAWLAALMAIEDQFQRPRVQIVFKALLDNFKSTDSVKYARELLRAVEWATERMRQPSADAFYLKECFIVSSSFWKYCLAWIIADVPPAMRKHAAELLRAIASETDQERQLREQKAKAKAAAAAALPAAGAAKSKAKAGEAKKDEEGEGEEAEEAEDDEEEGEDEEEEEDAPLFRPHPTRRDLLLAHLQFFIAHLPEQPQFALLPPRLEELWRLTRELCVTTEDKIALLGHEGVVSSLRRLYPVYNQANLSYDPSRLELVTLLEHVLYVTKSDEVRAAEAKQREADAIARKQAKLDAKAAGAAAVITSPPAALLPIRSLHLTTEEIGPNWVALAAAPDLAASFAATSITILRSPQSNGAYLENTLGRLWHIMRTMLNYKPALHSYINAQQPYQWALPNLVIKEGAAHPRLEALCSQPDGLFCHLLRLSDQQTAARAAAANPPASASFRVTCMSEWFSRSSDPNPTAHKLHWLRQRRMLPLLNKYSMMLLRTDEHADEDAAEFLQHDCFVTLAPLLSKCVKDDDASQLAHFPGLVQLVWQLIGRHADACRRAMQEARDAKQAVALPLAALPSYVSECFSDEDTVRVARSITNFAIWLLHWWQSIEEAAAATPAVAAAAKSPAPRLKPTLVEVAAAAAAAGAAANPAAAAAAPAHPIRSQSTASFPGLGSVHSVDGETRQRLHDILLVAVCSDRGFAEAVLVALVQKRLARYVLDASVEESAAAAAAAAAGADGATEDAQMSDGAVAAAAPAAAAPAAISSSSSAAPAHALLCGRGYVRLMDELAQLLLPGDHIVVAQEISRGLTLTLLEYHRLPAETGVTSADLDSLCAHLATLHGRHGMGCSTELLPRLWGALFDLQPRLLRHLDALALDSLNHGGPFIDPAPEDPSPQAKAQRDHARGMVWTWSAGQREAMLARALERLRAALAAGASSSPSDLLDALHPVSLLQRHALAAQTAAAPPADAAVDAPSAESAVAAESADSAALSQQLQRWSQQHAQLLVSSRPSLDALDSLLPAQPHVRDALRATLAALV